MIQTPDIQALNRWARRNGHNNFDTYIATGGNLLSAAESLVAERSDINRALAAIARYSPQPEPTPEPVWVPPGAMIEPLPPETPPQPDPNNAAVQGADA